MAGCSSTSPSDANTLSENNVGSDNSAGKKDANEDGRKNEVEPELERVAVEPAELTFFMNSGDSKESFDERFGDALREKFPQHTIEYMIKESGISVEQMIVQGHKFDIIFNSPQNFFGMAIGDGFAFDMTELIAKHDVDLSNVEQQSIEAMKRTAGGAIYGLPVFNNNMITYYNKAVFDQFGISYPEDGMTWDEIFDLSNQLTRIEDGVSYFGFILSPTHMFRMNPLSIPHVDLETETPTIGTDPRWQTFVDTFFIKPFAGTIYQEFIANTGNIPTMNEFVGEQNIGIFPYLSTWMNVWAEQLSEVDWDIVSFPSFADHAGVGSQAYPTYFGVTEISESKDAAMEVIKYMISPEFQQHLAHGGNIPILEDEVVRKTFIEESIHSDKNLNAIFYNEHALGPEQSVYENAVISRVFTSLRADIIRGDLDLNTALNNAHEAAIQTLSEMKQ